MNNAASTKSTRPNPKIQVTVLENGHKIPASITNIRQRKISLVSKKRILPGLRVKIAMGQIDNYAIGGVVQWALLVNNKGEFQYRTAIKADEILTPDDILTINSF